MDDDGFGDRAEVEDYERLGAQHLLRSRHLADVAIELLHRGDVVAVEVAAGAFTGTVVHAAADLLCLATRAGTVDVNLAAPLAVGVVERVSAGGRGRSGGAASFKARLFQHEASGAVVELGGVLPRATVSGTIVAVARDHVVVDDTAGGRWYVALAAIGYCVARRL